MTSSILDTSATTGTDVFHSIPLGTVICYFDGTPRPPSRFTRKLQCWHATNGVGRLVRKDREHASGSYPHEPTFTLHIRDFCSSGVHLMASFQELSVNSQLRFDVVETPPPGNVGILRDWNGASELLHLAASPTDATAWLAANGYSDARLDVVS
jgi:hypothetical protein